MRQSLFFNLFRPTSLKEIIKNELSQHLAVAKKLDSDSAWVATIEKIVGVCLASFRAGGKLLLCGNGGSAADAQHIAAELSGRYLIDRDPLHAEALHVNSSYLTAVANDYDFTEVYARAVLAKGKPNDVLIGISASGNSPNIVKALEKAKELDMHTIAFTGASDCKIADIADFCLRSPSLDTPRIQEFHIFFGHTICLLIEQALFGKK